jgi:serine/threonine-protein kinase
MHTSAEADHDSERAAQVEVPLRAHADALPTEHPVRRRVATYLNGEGALTLHTDPPGAEVLLHRYEVRNRRLVAVLVRSLGTTPLRSVPLPMGSYLCLLRHPGRAEVRYPVCIGRGEHAHGVAPSERETRAVRLPGRSELDAEDCLIPAGWFWSGGDPEALGTLPRRRLWCDDVVVRRFPVTNREYIRFLDDLVARGQDELALEVQPRERAAAGGTPVYQRDMDGRFSLGADADGDVWHLDWPVVLVDSRWAGAYASWLAEATGRPWRLPGELEWEKAARGVDGRHFPWGDWCDPSWCCFYESQSNARLPAVVDSYPVDESVYGVRGLGGNVQDWCADPFCPDGPLLSNDTVVPVERQGLVGVGGAPTLTIRGGFFSGADLGVRAAYRPGPGSRREHLGFRLLYRRGA